jgi:biopolymer transport protein ExbB
MAETRPTATTSAAKSATSVQPKKKSNAISWIAPVVCFIAGFVIWRFILGNPNNFDRPDLTGGFFPKHQEPKSGLYRMYEGGVIVPILLACFLTVLTFVIERFMTIS